MVTEVGGVKSTVAAVREGADGHIEEQDISVSDDRIEFQFGLEQAIKQRAGLVAQMQLQERKTDYGSMMTHDLRSCAGRLCGGIDGPRTSFKPGGPSPLQEEHAGDGEDYIGGARPETGARDDVRR